MRRRKIFRAARKIRNKFNMPSIGKRNSLKIVRAAPPGLYLDAAELGEILLPGKLVPRNVQLKDLVDVFIYTDSEDRLVATTETPLAEVGEFAALKVVSVNRNVGAFLDWGLSKDLLLPYREQERPPRVGDKIFVAVCLDPVSNRVVASARISRYLQREIPEEWKPGQPVNLQIAGTSPLGYNAIIEGCYRGLLYKDRTNAPLEIGQKLKGFIRAIRDGGKVDLSLDGPGARQQVTPLTTLILNAMRENGGTLPYDDSADPGIIRQKFNISKNVFKQALGNLYKRKRIEFTNPGIKLTATEGDISTRLRPKEKAAPVKKAAAAPKPAPASKGPPARFPFKRR